MNLYGFKVIYTLKYEFVHLDAKSGAVTGCDAVVRRTRNNRLSGRNFTLFCYWYIYCQVKGWDKMTALFAIIYKMIATIIIYGLKSIVIR